MAVSGAEEGGQFGVWAGVDTHSGAVSAHAWDSRRGRLTSARAAACLLPGGPVYCMCSDNRILRILPRGLFQVGWGCAVVVVWRAVLVSHVNGV